MKTVCTIEARMESSRLPGKVLLEAAGKPLLEHMVERLRRVDAIDDIVIATTVDPSCDPIEELAKRIGVGCYRGSEDDVLDRVLQAAASAKADLIVETTGDCPLIDPAVIDQVIGEFHEHGPDYCANVLKPGWPRGMDIQVFPFKVLEEVAGLTSDPHDREHVSIYIYSHPEKYGLRHVSCDLPNNASELRLTVDTPADFEVVKAVFEKLYPTEPNFDLNAIIRLAAREPELFAANSEIRQKPIRVDTGRR